jgi:phage terminase large subunit
LPENAQLLGSGLDFGFSQDPTSLISVYRYNGEIIVDEKIYQKGLLNSQIANLIKTTDSKDAVIYADSAEPKSIAELRAYGLTVLPVVKGKDSINYGISLMQEHQFKVTSRSTNLIKELQNYTWAKDREGNSLNVPIDNWNHAIDALRYFFLMKMGNKKTTFALKWKR